MECLRQIQSAELVSKKRHEPRARRVTEYWWVYFGHERDYG